MAATAAAAAEMLATPETVYTDKSDRSEDVGRHWDTGRGGRKSS